MGVTCPHCRSRPGEVCLGPAWKGKGPASRRPLRYSAAHPQRVALAAAINAGANAHEARVAARFAVLTIQPAEIVPYLEAARLAVEDAACSSVGLYRKRHPPAPGMPEPSQFELELQ